MVTPLHKEYLIGRRYARLVIVDTWHEPRGDRRYNKVRMVRCRCDCGTADFVAFMSNVHAGATKSCGCLRVERRREQKMACGPASPNYKHGLSKSPLYVKWKNMLARGDIAEEWLDFSTFHAGVGEMPRRGASPVRKDRSKPLGPDNFVGWGTRAEGRRQADNAVLLTYNDRKLTMSEWSREFNVSRQRIWAWVNVKPRSAREIQTYLATLDIHANHQSRWRKR